MTPLPPCPVCNSTLSYEDGSGNYVCPECAHEWPVAGEAASEETARVWRDAAGNVLQDGDLLITQGAGDIGGVAARLAAAGVISGE